MRTALMILGLLIACAGSGTAGVVHPSAPNVVAMFGQNVLTPDGEVWRGPVWNALEWERLPWRDVPVPISQIRFWYADVFLTVSGEYYWLNERDPDNAYWTNAGFPGSDPVAVPPGRVGVVPFSIVPNPTTGSIRIQLAVTGRSPVEVRVVDVTGRTVWSLPETGLGAGTHQVEWDGRDSSERPVPSGVYFCHVRCGDVTVARRVVLAR